VRVLLIEDEHHLREALRRGLSEAGDEVVGAATGPEGLRLAREQVFDVIVCDILLPGLNGFQVCRRLREQAVWTPVLVLTAKDGEWDQAEALDAGADDYLTKPFSYVVLRAHLRALARRGARSDNQGADLMRWGDIVLDKRAHRCSRAGRTVELSNREFELLAELLASGGRAVTKSELLERVWGPGFNGDPNIVEVYVGYLRRKLDAPFGRRSLETVRGVGYRLAPDEVD
jgi:DNA-binding response OmpR family regulator